MNDSGLVLAWLLDGQGGGRAMDWPAIEQWQPDDGQLWVHLDRDSAESKHWLLEQSGLDEVAAKALLADSTRPRTEQMTKGVMLFLRGVNLNPGADPEDMVSIRLWIEKNRVITLRSRRLLSVVDVSNSLLRNDGPRDVGELVVKIANRLVSRMTEFINDVDDQVDELQDQVLESAGRNVQTDLTRLRREIIALRRYLSPQRDALAKLSQLRTDWLNSINLAHYREEADRVTRLVEDLDALRERAMVAQEELTTRMSEQLNGRMYVLSVLSAIFLPLGFVTGLLGINVGGIPLAESPWGFTIVVSTLLLITGMLLVLFRWRRWL